MFGFWSIVKFIMMITMQQEYADKIFETSQVDGVPDSTILAVDIIFFILVSLFVIWIHLWIGLGAIKYAQGKKKRRTHLILAIIGVLITIAQMPFYFYDPVEKVLQSAQLMDIASIMVDITLIFLFLDMIVSTIQIDKLISKD